MTPTEFKIKHNLSDEDMLNIRRIIKIFNGKIYSVEDINGDSQKTV